MVRISRPWRPLRTADLPASFVPPKNWDGKMVRVEHGPYKGRRGYPDANGNIWVPARPGESHGGPHFDVQLRGGRDGHINVYPDEEGEPNNEKRTHH